MIRPFLVNRYSKTVIMQEIEGELNMEISSSNAVKHDAKLRRRDQGEKYAKETHIQFKQLDKMKRINTKMISAEGVCLLQALFVQLTCCNGTVAATEELIWFFETSIYLNLD